MKEELWKQVSVKGYNFCNKPTKDNENNNQINFLHLIQHLWQGSWKDHIKEINIKIKLQNNQPSSYSQKNTPSDRAQILEVLWDIVGSKA